MGVKSYLQDQVYLPGFNSQDLFTDEEDDWYKQMIEASNELDRIDKGGGEKDQEEKRKWAAQKRKARQMLNALVLSHAGVPRTVRLKNIVYHDKNDKETFPPGVSWKNMKFSKKISEFSSELTRAMGLKHMDKTFDHIVIKWRDVEVLKQIVLDGFYLPILNPDGTVTNKHYRFFTASAGQLRHDKCQFISDEIWEKIHERIECGLTWDKINNSGKVNVN